jgi:thiol:disulfide interchange protein
VKTSPDDYSSAYDPGRDPAKDLEKAKAAATQQHKRILIEVGGNWCIWCKMLDKFFAEQPDIRQLRDSNFVLMKVNMGPLNENVAFLNQYPKITGYPYLFVLDSDGKLIVAKDTEALEQGSGYSAKNFTDFLNSMKGQ